MSYKIQLFYTIDGATNFLLKIQKVKVTFFWLGLIPYILKWKLDYIRVKVKSGNIGSGVDNGLWNKWKHLQEKVGEFQKIFFLMWK